MRDLVLFTGGLRPRRTDCGLGLKELIESALCYYSADNLFYFISYLLFIVSIAVVPMLYNNLYLVWQQQ